MRISEVENLIDVHELLNKESDETINESIKEMRSYLSSVNYIHNNFPCDDEHELFQTVIDKIYEIKQCGYREGYADAIKQMKAVVSKTRTRREQIEREKTE